MSNTIDLDSTRVRAEALFYRFKRLVDAADRKKFGSDMTGLPEVKQQRISGQDAGPVAEASGSSATSGATTTEPRRAIDVLSMPGAGPNISDELRTLLGRHVIRVEQHQS